MHGGGSLKGLILQRSASEYSACGAGGAGGAATHSATEIRYEDPPVDNDTTELGTPAGAPKEERYTLRKRELKKTVKGNHCPRKRIGQC